MSQITNNIVVQLARFNDTSAISNSEWSNYQKETITINQGDSIAVSKAFIDTRNLSTNAIVILEDTPLELEMFFYWINDGNPGSDSSGFKTLAGNGVLPWYMVYGTDSFPPFSQYTVELTLQSVLNIVPSLQNSVQQNPFADGRPYLLQYTDNSPYTQTWRYTLPKGTYSPDALANLLTTNMAEVKKNTAQSLSKPNAIDWFDPYAPKVNLPKKTTLDQPFIVNTNSNPPLWTMPFVAYEGDTIEVGTLSAQISLQIAPNTGLPINWYQGSTGILYYTYPEPFDVDPYDTIYPRDVPSKKSLCFKNIISDCPIPDAETNLPVIPGNPNNVINAAEMIVGLYYQIVALGQYVNWAVYGDLNNPPAVGDKFACISNTGGIPNNNPSIPFLDMSLNGFYKVASSGYPWTGVGGFDTNWSLYGNNGTVGTAVNVGNIQPTEITLTNSTDLTLINLNITYTITASSGGIDWSDFGAPEPPLPPTISYTDMVVGKQYIITNFGLPYNDLLNPNNTYDTNWLNLFNISGPPVLNQPYTCNNNNSIAIVNLLQSIQQNINYTITYTRENINWAYYGYNYINPNPNVSILAMNATEFYQIVNVGFLIGQYNGQPLYDCDWATILSGTYPPGDGIVPPSVGLIFQDLVPDETYLYTYINNGVLLNLLPVLQNNPIQLKFNNTYNLGITVNWSNYGNLEPQEDDSFLLLITSNPGGVDPNLDDFIGYIYPPTSMVQLHVPYPVPFTFTATQSGAPNTADFYNGIINGTGMVQEAQNINYPFTFKCTKIPSVLPQNITYSGSLVPAGTVNLNISDGLVFECGVDPNNPNFYLYPLKLTSNPLINVNFSESTPPPEEQGFTIIPCIMADYNFPLIGSTEIELAFNDQSNIFQWNYTHSPILQATAPSGTNAPVSFSEVVGIVHSFLPLNTMNETPYNPQNKGFVSSTCKLVAKSGCMFRKMEPKSFWFDILGFSPDILVTDEELGLSNDGTLKPIALPKDLNRFTYERFNNVTTRSLLSTAMNFTQSPNFPNSEPSYVPGMYYPNPASAPVQSLNSSVIDSWYDYEMAYNFAAVVVGLFNSSAGNTGAGFTGYYASPPQWQESWYQALDTTVSLNAIAPPTIITSQFGHYLISIQGYGDDKNGLLNENAKFNSKAIVSNYYVNAGSFVTQPFEDPQIYIHVGESMTLSNYKVLILQPDTMLPIEGLGNNSSVYIQIAKAYSKVELSQLVD